MKQRPPQSSTDANLDRSSVACETPVLFAWRAVASNALAEAFAEANGSRGDERGDPFGEPPNELCLPRLYRLEDKTVHFLHITPSAAL